MILVNNRNVKIVLAAIFQASYITQYTVIVSKLNHKIFLVSLTISENNKHNK